MPTQSRYEQQQAVGLQRMKRYPLALLGIMLLLYLLSWERSGVWVWVAAFAEAAMVGALADWFAVTALFRHPLGLPIPHTAIIARRKDEIGESLAVFVAENFLQEKVLEQRLLGQDFSSATLDWLAQETNKRKVVANIIALWSWLMGAVGENRVRVFINRLVQRHSSRMDLAGFAGQALDVLTKNGRHQEIFTQALRFCIVALNENSGRIHRRIQQESPWWMPGFVDDKIVGQMIQRIQTLLFEMALDPEHELRQRFDQQILRLSADMQQLPEYRLLGEKIKHDFMNNIAIQDYFLMLWGDFSDQLDKARNDSNAGLSKKIENLLQNLIDEFSADPAMQALVNQWLRAAVGKLVSENRENISTLISETVKSWDAETTSRRLELAIGRDLQYIRINGTLVGGLVGLILQALSRVMSSVF